MSLILIFVLKYLILSFFLEVSIRSPILLNGIKDVFFY